MRQAARGLNYLLSGTNCPNWANPNEGALPHTRSTILPELSHPNVQPRDGLSANTFSDIPPSKDAFSSSLFQFLIGCLHIVNGRAPATSKQLPLYFREVEKRKRLDNYRADSYPTSKAYGLRHLTKLLMSAIHLHLILLSLASGLGVVKQGVSEIDPIGAQLDS
ncbi:hypothetical protein RND71_039893 [Anisodus tanguticus]|uniref:Uncharacterized protein n=1 Tax=Anisodus tanguticus TaxID=243964 RepID=A0AAE1USE5_9SOLA|nr:hypothetical protein RND71_039893 [Anisodus tanguticus]